MFFLYVGRDIKLFQGLDAYSVLSHSCSQFFCARWPFKWWEHKKIKGLKFSIVIHLSVCHKLLMSCQEKDVVRPISSTHFFLSLPLFSLMVCACVCVCVCVCVSVYFLFGIEAVGKKWGRGIMMIFLSSSLNFTIENLDHSRIRISNNCNYFAQRWLYHDLQSSRSLEGNPHTKLVRHHKEDLRLKPPVFCSLNINIIYLFIFLW